MPKEIQEELVSAARSGSVAEVKQLLEKKANIDIGGIDTPLVGACFSNKVEVVKILCDHKADLSKKNYFGYFPLQAAAKYGHSDVIKTLIQYNCNINQTDENGFSALFIAVTEYESESKFNKLERGKLLTAIEKLVENGADIRSKDEWGDTPLSVSSATVASSMARHQESYQKNIKEILVFSLFGKKAPLKSITENSIFERKLIGEIFKFVK